MRRSVKGGECGSTAEIAPKNTARQISATTDDKKKGLEAFAAAGIGVAPSPRSSRYSSCAEAARKEAEEDEAIYEKMACWRETSDKDKTKAIVDAETRIGQLTAKIEALTANSARLETETKNLESEVAKNQEEDEAIYEKMACWCETND